MTLSVDRAWNTWSGSVPGNMIHLPSGFAARVSVFDGDFGSLEDFHDRLDRKGSHIELGNHMMNGELVEFVLCHSNLHVDVSFAKVTPFLIVGTVRFREVSRWNAHIWLNLEVGYSDDFPAPDENLTLGALDSGSRHVWAQPSDARGNAPMLASRWRSQEFRVTTSARPTRCDIYPSRSELEQDYEVRGAGFVRPPTTRGRWAAFRYNVEGTHSFDFVIAQGPDGPKTAQSALEALGDAPAVVSRRRAEAELGSAPNRAVRDVVAWNTVWDPATASPYTCLTRNWLKGLGGRSIWLTDVMYNALLAAVAGDWQLADENLDEVLSGQQASGLVPGLVAGSTEWVDRTQFPVLSYIVWRTYLLTGNLTKLASHYPVLRRYQDWQYAERDGNGNGLLEHGSEPIGLALNAGSRWAAINESGMDNLPVFDDAVYDDNTHTLDFEEVGHNSFLVLGYEMLANIARALGRTDEASELSAEQRRLAQLVRDRLWDDERRVFAGRLWSGRFATHLSPTSFYPLVAGIASEEQARILVEEHLLNPDEFWGGSVIPTTPRNDPVARDNAYWRGRVWPPLNFFVWEGLRRYGYFELASELAERSWHLFDTGWSSRRHAHENFQMWETDNCDWPDSDGFYSWGAMMPLMASLEVADANPWYGVTLSAQAGAAVLARPGETLCLVPGEVPRSVKLVLNGLPVCTVIGCSLLSNVAVDKSSITFRCGLGSIPAPQSLRVVLEPERRSRLRALMVNGQSADIATLAGDDGATWPGSIAPTQLEMLFSA